MVHCSLVLGLCGLPQISDPRTPTALRKGKPVKQVASSFANFASPLRSLRLRSFLKRKGREAKPRKGRRGLHLEFQISDLRFGIDRLSIRAFVANRSFLRLAALQCGRASPTALPRGKPGRWSRSCRRRAASKRTENGELRMDNVVYFFLRNSGTNGVSD